MRKVLMIANQFPPMGGSGVQRTSKFVKHLKSFGWLPVVLTRSIGNMQLIDSSLLNDIPSDVLLFRTRSFDLTELPSVFGLLGKVIARKILIPDGEYIWALFSRRCAVNIIKAHKIDIVYTTSYPYSDHLLGFYLKKKFPYIRWVVDFRDEWTNNPYTLDNPHNILRSALEKKMELKILTNADIIVTNTPVMKQNFINIVSKHIPNSFRNKFFVIPNGYDEEDFTTLKQSSEMRDNDKFTITYTGSLYGRRKPDTFFSALSNLVSSGEIDRDSIEVVLIGNFKIKELNDKISNYGLSGIVSVKGYMPHNECLDAMLNSDVLLLLEGSGVGAEAFYTGKVFEYMNTNRPVLAVIPKNGVAAKLVIDSNIGIVADFDDVPGISEALIHYYNSYKNNSLVFKPNIDIIKKYERKQLTKSLAELFETL